MPRSPPRPTSWRRGTLRPRASPAVSGAWCSRSTRRSGYDWQLTVGVLTSFLAREVFVSTMAVLITGEEIDDPADDGVIARVRNAKRDDGSPLFTTATAASLLVFFVLAMQCLPTLVVTRRETGGWRWAVLQLAWMTSLAWVPGLRDLPRAASGGSRLMPWGDWQFWLVTLAAAWGVWAVARQVLPGKKRDEAPCSTCAVGSAAQAARDKRAEVADGPDDRPQGAPPGGVLS